MGRVYKGFALEGREREIRQGWEAAEGEEQGIGLGLTSRMSGSFHPPGPAYWERPTVLSRLTYSRKL